MRDCVEIDAMEIWTKDQTQFPILAPVAHCLLISPSISASTDRLFSAGGRVCTFDMACLTFANVNILPLVIFGKEVNWKKKIG